MRNRFQKARARTGGLQLCHYAANYKLTGLSRYKHICCWVRINKRIFCLLTRLFAEVSWAAVTKLDDWLPVHLAYPIQLPAFHLSLSWQMCLLRVWYWPAQLWLWCLWTLSLDSVILDFEVSFDASVFPVSVQTRNINVSNHPSFHFLCVNNDSCVLTLDLRIGCWVGMVIAYSERLLQQFHSLLQ